MKASLILAAVGAAALMFPNFARGFFDRRGEGGRMFAFGRWAVPWIVILVFVFSIALTIFFRLPEPRIHDEFSYLLQSDTFAHGRLANPTHPLWRYFETFHVLQVPHYVSKYQPGQGL